MPHGRSKPEEDRVARAQVQEAVKGLPAALTNDYHIALDAVPELVMTETDPLKFLRCERGNPWSAALRLVQNWTYRRKHFGESHWLRPMRLRDGALTDEDVKLLQTGAILILTPPEPNRSQIFMLNFGRSKDFERARNGLRPRIFQYLGLTTLNEYSQRHGVDVMVILDGNGRLPRPDWGRYTQATHFVSTFKIQRWIFVSDPRETRVALTNLFRTILCRMVTSYWDANGRPVNVSCSTPEESRKALEDVGLHPSNIPTFLGGQFDYDRDVKEWLAMRLLTELGAMESSSTENADNGKEPTDKQLSEDDTFEDFEYFKGTPNEYSNDAPSVGSELSELFRTTSPHYPKTDEPSNRFPLDSDYTSNASVMRLKPEARSSAKKTRGGLVSAAGEALRDQIAQPKEVIKKRNCAYSKRHYYKKKNEIKCLEDEIDGLRKHQKRLRDEQVFLENLIMQTNQLVPDNSLFEINHDDVAMEG